MSPSLFLSPHAGQISQISANIASTAGLPSDATGCFDLTRLIHLTRLHYSLPSSVKVDLWLRTFLRTSIGTLNSLQVITLCFPPPLYRAEWNALDLTLSNATSISQAHLSLVLVLSSPDYGSYMWDLFAEPEFTKKYIPNLLERGGFSIDVENGAWGVSGKMISFPRRQMGGSECT